jgi:hypothetical protein
VFFEGLEDSAYRYPRPTPLVRPPHAALHERRINLLPIRFPLLLWFVNSPTDPSITLQPPVLFPELTQQAALAVHIFFLS